jgi:hypothetical protein
VAAVLKAKEIEDPAERAKAMERAIAEATARQAQSTLNVSAHEGMVKSNRYREDDE